MSPFIHVFLLQGRKSLVYIDTDGVGCSLHDDLHGLEVIPSYFRVRYTAVTLRGSDRVVPQEILDRREIGVGIQHLCGHRMSKTMTGDSQIRFVGIILHPFLDAANR